MTQGTKPFLMSSGQDLDEMIKVLESENEKDKVDIFLLKPFNQSCDNYFDLEYILNQKKKRVKFKWV